MKPTEELAADSSALIYLAKADAFSHVRAINTILVVVPGVWEEAVVEGRRLGYSDAASIDAADERGWLRRVPLPASQLELSKIVAVEDRLGMGESQVIVLAVAAHMRAIIDDRRAARAARARGVVAFSTLALGMLARRAGMSLTRSLDLTRALAVAAGTRVDVLQEYERRIREEDP